MKHRHYEVLVSEIITTCHDIICKLNLCGVVHLSLHVATCVATCTCFCFSVWNTVSGKHRGQSIQPCMLTQKPSAIQDVRTFFLTINPSDTCDYVNERLSDVEQANKLTIALHHSSASKAHVNMHLFGWNYIVDWSHFLVF